MKSLRKQIERDMGLQEDALKPHKLLLSDLIDKVRRRVHCRQAPTNLDRLSVTTQCAGHSSSSQGGGTGGAAGKEAVRRENQQA